MDLHEPGPSGFNRGNLQIDEDSPQPIPSNMEEQETNSCGDVRPVSGLLSSYHGVAYQVLWNMVVALEAKHRLDGIEKKKSGFTFKTKDFKTEEPTAGKFDDVVWRYEIGGPNESANGKMYEYNFLQAKHKLKQDEKISIDKLLRTKQNKELVKRKEKEDKRPFALEKYFISYKDKIKKEKKYEDGDINNLIIATNIDLDEDLKNNLFSKVKNEKIPILDLIKTETNKEPDAWKIEGDRFKRLKTKKDRVSCPYEKVVKQLRSTYNSIRLANELVESLLKNKLITGKSFLGPYLYDLTHNKITAESGKLPQVFLENSAELSPKAKEFRRFLLKVGFEDKRPSCNGNYEISEPDEFAQKVASLIKSSAGKSDEVKIIRGKRITENIDKLVNYVFVEDDKNKVKFSDVFWRKKKNELPGNLIEFRDQLICKLVQNSMIDQNDGPAEIAKKLQDYRFKIKDFSTCNEHLVDESSFWKAMEKGTVIINTSTIFPFKLELPKDSMEDMQSDINEFFSKLKFVINYSQNHLDELVKKKCRKFTGFVSDFVAYKFQVKMEKILNLSSKDFISESEQVDVFFKESVKQVEALTLIGLTLEYRAKIKLYGIEFSTKLVEDLLKVGNESGHFLDSNKQVFNLITKQKDLTYIKFIQALEARCEDKNHGNYASMSLNSALLLQNLVVGAFESETNNLLVIMSGAIERNIDVFLYFELFSRLSGVLKTNKSKKIILITQEKEDLATRFKDHFPDKYEEKEDTQIGLFDLTEESQEKILKERTLLFQGIETTLEKLLFNKDLKGLVNGEVLFDILRGDCINIGSCLPSIADENSPAYFKIMEVIHKQNLKNIQNDILVFSGINRESLARELKLEENKIVEGGKETIFSQEQSFQFAVLGSENNDNIVNYFEYVCSQYQKSLSTELTEKREKRLIHLIEFHEGNFIWNRFYDSKFYIDRYFNKILIDEKFMEPDGYHIRKDKYPRNLFLIGKIQKDEFVKLYGIDKEQVASTLAELNQNEPIFILSTDDGENEAEEAMKFLPHYCNIHWIENKDNRFIWKRSKGEIKTISKYCRNDFDTQDNKVYESKIVDIIKNERFIVIADVPGMGKSTTLLSLSKLYKRCNPLDWVIKVNLKECESTIDTNLRDYEDSMDQKLKKVTVGRIVKFLSKIDPEGMKHSFATKLLRHKIFTNSGSGILLLLDGFDEIRDTNLELKFIRQKKVFQLLGFLKKSTDVKVLITTRLYEEEKRKLESALSVLSHSFNPITDDQGREYIERVWQNSSKLLYEQNAPITSHYKTCVAALYDKSREVFGKSLSSFVGVPLQLQMLAGAYLKKYKEFEKNRNITDETSAEELLKDLNFSNLYADFIARKYDIYFQEKKMFGKTVADSDKEILEKRHEKDHKRLAFKYIAGESPESLNKYFKLFSPGKNRVDEKRVRQLNKIGIIQSQGIDKMNFVHRTFAEYYVSELIFDTFQKKAMDSTYTEESKKEMWEFLLHHVFLHDDYNVIRNFINSKLSTQQLFVDFETNFVEHKNIVHDLLEKTTGDRKIALTESTKFAESCDLIPLEVAAHEDLSEIVEFILKIAPSNYITDTHFRSSPEQWFTDTPISSTAWDIAISACSLNVIKVLVKYAKKIGKCQDLVDFDHHLKYRTVDSPLHFAASCGAFEIVQFLVKSGASTRSKVDSFYPQTNRIEPQPFGGFTPLHCAFMAREYIDSKNGNDRLKTIQYLLENGSDVTAEDDEGNTSLHLACAGSSILSSEVMDSEYLKNSLRRVVRLQSLETMEEMVKLLVMKAQQARDVSVSNFVNTRNKKGITAIFLAAASGLWKVVGYLIGSVDRVRISEHWDGVTALHFLAAEAKEDVTNMMGDFLRKSGIDVNVKTTEAPDSMVVVSRSGTSVAGETPLHWAAKNNNVKAVEFLLNVNDIDKNVKNKEGRTALDLALLANHADVIRLMRLRNK